MLLQYTREAVQYEYSTQWWLFKVGTVHEALTLRALTTNEILGRGATRRQGHTSQ